ncbi:MAG TPA: bifunctional riboflavin kinase/FAD synthetase [Chloroflexota bacterium]|nr:bifunctional riboflavin kinase/FAD synthetase [Chloroflexota bacterium]
MKVEWLDGLDSGPEDNSRSVLSIGGFDGVHRGHQFLIGCAANEATEGALETVVMTFDPLPALLLAPGSGVKALTDIEERLALLAALPVDTCAVLRFRDEIAHVEAEDFLRSIVSRFNVASLWAGADFGFGHRRSGNVDLLRRLQSDLRYQLHVVPRQTFADQQLSSSHIRQLVEAGEIVEGNRLLGHCFTVSGTIVRGAGRGRELGFPTANLEVEPHHVVPATGIYAGHATLGSSRHGAAISVGYNPTFGRNPLSVEAYLLDFDEDIYDRRLQLDFEDRVRDELTFGSIKDLVQQMGRDVERVRELLQVESPASAEWVGSLE